MADKNGIRSPIYLEYTTRWIYNKKIYTSKKDIFVKNGDKDFFKNLAILMLRITYGFGKQFLQSKYIWRNPTIQIIQQRKYDHDYDIE